MRMGLIISICLLCGCGNHDKKNNKDTRVVLTTGWAKDEVFRIEKASCTVPEVMIYLMNTKNEYESTFGEGIWDVSQNGETLQDNVKETVLARLARVKAMNLLAQTHEIALDEQELEQTKKAAKEYMDTLSVEEVEALDVNEALITQMYQEYALADKVYQYLIADINPEISDDEARTITIERIFIKTYHLDEKGEKQEYSEQSKSEAHEKIKEALNRARDGENFSSLVAEYSEEKTSIYSIGKSTQPDQIETVAFELSTGEISKIITMEDGYYILKCINTFDREETDRNKMKIVEQRRREVFEEEYMSFIVGLTKTMNEKLWDDISFIEEPEVSTNQFFEIYRKYMD